MKNLFTAVICTLLLTSCTAPHTKSIVGLWQTDEIQSQLGPSVIVYTFNTDGTFSVEMTFTHDRIPTMDASGSYKVTSNEIIITGKGRTNVASYAFEGETLVINEGPSKIFRLKKKK